MTLDSTVEIGDGRMLAYTAKGPASDDAVVLLPGPTDSSRSYQPVLASLPGGLRAVAVSLRGHGYSYKPKTGYSIEELASDVVPLLDALDIERAVLVGHSGSCLVARRVAIDAPDRVAGLLLEASPTTLVNDPDLLAFVDSVISNLPDPIDRHFARSFIADTATEQLDPDFLDLLVDDLIRVPIAAWSEMFASLLAYDDTTELAHLQVPVTLVWGDADPLVPLTMQDQLLERMPQSELRTYEGTGHTPRWEDPRRFASDIVALAELAFS